MQCTEYCTMKIRTAVCVQNGCACVGCWPSWWRVWLGAVAGWEPWLTGSRGGLGAVGDCEPWWPATAQRHGRGSYCMQLVQEKIRIPNSKHGFYWLDFAFAPSWSWKIHCKPGAIRSCYVPDTVWSFLYTLIDSILKMTLLVEILLITNYRNFS